MSKKISTRRDRWAIMAVALTILALGSLQASTAQATTHHRAAGKSVKPTVVLVHGAFADAGGWSDEVTGLQRRGYDVIAPANPLRGLTSDSDYLRSILVTIPGPIVLVGHSYGGAVITNAARGVPNVKALVYVGAFVPDAGESIVTSYDAVKYPGSQLGPETTMVRPTFNPAVPGGQDLDVYIKPTAFRNVFAGDQRQTVAEAMAATQRPLSYFAQSDPSGDPAWKTIPSWDLITLDDHAISAGGQMFMARRAGSSISKVHSAHDVMISHPAAVVKLVLQAAGAVS